MPGGLKLKAVDAADIEVLSAILQDALVPVAEMVYLPDERRFVVIANRFRWEPGAEPLAERFERTLSGLCVENVSRVQRRGFSPLDLDRILALLALRAVEGAIYLEFAGGSSIRLDVAEIACRLDDLGEPWTTKWRPRHPVDG
jgi:hypothetical protein